MTLDDIEKLSIYAADTEERDLRDIAECRRMEAINTLTGAARGATETAAQLARAVLAMLPVVRAAEALKDAERAWLAETADRPTIESFPASLKYGIDEKDRALGDAIDALRAALEKS